MNFGVHPQPSAARARIDALGHAYAQAKAQAEQAALEARLPKVALSTEPPKRDWLAMPAFDPFITKPNRILMEVAAKHGVTVLDIKSARRQQRLVRARHEACWRLRAETMWSLPQIGRFLGDRDHTTALHGIRQHEKRIAQGEA